MRYPKDRATQTRHRIVRSAYWRFATKGFEATSIEEVMSDCDMTRGSFYAHFRSKRDLYREAMSYRSELQERRSADSPDSAEQWIESLLRKYLHDASDSRRTSASLSLIAEAGAELDAQTRAPAAVFRSMTKGILASAAERSSCSEEATLSAAAMLIGTLAIARTSDDAALKEKLISACRSKVRMLLEREADGSPNFFWAPLQPSERM